MLQNENNIENGLRNRWLVWYAGMMTTIFVCILTVEKEKLATPDYWDGFTVGVIVAGITASILTWVILEPLPRFWKKYYRRKHAFKFGEGEPYQKAKLVELPIGEKNISLWVSPWRKANIEWFAIRFVPTASTAREAEQVPASVISIKDPELVWRSSLEKENIEYKFSPIEPKKTNDPSMWRCKFKNSITLGSDDYFGVSFTAIATKKWKGFFSVQSLIEGPKNESGRIKVVVKKK